MRVATELRDGLGGASSNYHGGGFDDAEAKRCIGSFGGEAVLRDREQENICGLKTWRWAKS